MYSTKIPGIGAKLSDLIAKADVLTKAEEEIKFINKNNINVLFYLDKHYPERLKIVMTHLYFCIL